MSTDSHNTKGAFPSFFLICCECGTIASMLGGGVKVAAFREDTGKIMWRSAETEVVLLFKLEKQAKSKNQKAELRLAQMTKSDVELVYFTSKELVSFFYFFDPAEEFFFFCFSFMPDETTKQKSNSQVNNCHCQPTALHYCLLYMFTFAALNK